MFGAVTANHLMPIAVSSALTPELAAAPTRNAWTLLNRSIPGGPRRLISLRVTSGIPLLVTHRIGASSGKWTSGVAVIAVSGSSGTSSVSPRGRSGTLCADGGSTAGQRCWVTATATSNGLFPNRRVVVFVATCGLTVGRPAACASAAVEARPVVALAAVACWAFTPATAGTAAIAALLARNERRFRAESDDFGAELDDMVVLSRRTTGGEDGQAP